MNEIWNLWGLVPPTRLRTTVLATMSIVLSTSESYLRLCGDSCSTCTKSSQITVQSLFRECSSIGLSTRVTWWNLREKSSPQASRQGLNLNCPRSFIIAYFSGPQSSVMYRDSWLFLKFLYMNKCKLIVYCGTRCFNQGKDILRKNLLKLWYTMQLSCNSLQQPIKCRVERMGFSDCFSHTAQTWLPLISQLKYRIK